MSSSLSPNELKKLLDSESATLVDVRRKADYDADPHLVPGAVWRNPEEVEAWSRELPQGKTVVVYCVKGGSVSQSITDALTRKQIDACYVKGGLKAWRDSGGPVE